MFTVYILRCADGSLYTGYARDIKSRLKKHQDGMGSKYVRSRLPAELVYTEVFSDRSLAMSKEAYIKSLDKLQKEKLIIESR